MMMMILGSCSNNDGDGDGDGDGYENATKKKQFAVVTFKTDTTPHLTVPLCEHTFLSLHLVLTKKTLCI